MILLDTHVLVWLDQGADFLGRRARGLIERSLRDEQLGVAAISFWEVAMLIHKNRLAFSGDLGEWRVNLLGSGFLEFPVSGEIAIQARELKDFDGDPADRLVAATAISLDARLITADERLLDFRRVKTVNARI